MVYAPRLLGVANLRFEDKKLAVNTEQKSVLLAEIADGAVPVDWATADAVQLSADDKTLVVLRRRA